MQMAHSINKAFLRRAIARAQRLSIADPFCQALHAYISRSTRFVVDAQRRLIWCETPDGLQVAVWLMPVTDVLIDELMALFERAIEQAADGQH